MKITCVVADFESTWQGWLHSLSYVPVTFDVRRGWKSHGRDRSPEKLTGVQVTQGVQKTILIRDTVTHASIREMSDVQKKLSATCIDAAETNQSVLYVMNFEDALAQFLADVRADGDGVWFGHSIDNDVEILAKTDAKLGTGLFTKDTRAYPETCCRLPDWPTVTRVCTQQILTRRCPRFWAAYGKSSARLADLAEHVGMVQTHTAIQDVQCLVAVLRQAYEQDKFRIEKGCSYMICKPAQTFSPLHHVKP